MIVYRIEHHETGNGPYYKYSNVYYELREELNNVHNDELTHPAFQADGITEHPLFKKDFHSGFAKLDCAEEWFFGFGKKLSENNFVIVVYEVDESCVIHGNSGKQIAFDLPKAELLRTEAIPFR